MLIIPFFQKKKIYKKSKMSIVSFVGTVISSGLMKKTVKVRTERIKIHPIVQKVKIKNY